MKIINWVAFILLIIGGLNWGLIGIADYNLVSAILGEGAAADIIYDLVGLSAIWVAVFGGKMMAGNGQSA